MINDYKRYQSGLDIPDADEDQDTTFVRNSFGVPQRRKLKIML